MEVAKGVELIRKKGRSVTYFRVHGHSPRSRNSYNPILRTSRQSRTIGNFIVKGLTLYKGQPEITFLIFLQTILVLLQFFHVPQLWSGKKLLRQNNWCIRFVSVESIQLITHEDTIELGPKLAITFITAK